LVTFALVGTAVVAAATVWFMRTSEDRPDATGWRPSEIAAFLNNCIEQCRGAPGVTPERRPLCDNACKCAADEARKVMTARELDAAAQAVNNNTATEKQKTAMAQLQQAGLRCVEVKLPEDKPPAPPVQK
jgi:hypothetical protein